MKAFLVSYTKVYVDYSSLYIQGTTERKEDMLCWGRDEEDVRQTMSRGLTTRDRFGRFMQFIVDLKLRPAPEVSDVRPNQIQQGSA